MPRAPCEAVSAPAGSTGSTPGPGAAEQVPGFWLLLSQAPLSTDRAGGCWAPGQQASPSG